jgi:hypothetical protein
MITFMLRNKLPMDNATRKLERLNFDLVIHFTKYFEEQIQSGKKEFQNFSKVLFIRLPQLELPELENNSKISIPNLLITVTFELDNSSEEFPGAREQKFLYENLDLKFDEGLNRFEVV